VDNCHNLNLNMPIEFTESFEKDPAEDGLAGYMNRIHQDRKFKASSRSAVFACLSGCLEVRDVASEEKRNTGGVLRFQTRALVCECLKELEALDLEKATDEIQGLVRVEITQLEYLIRQKVCA
jgi:hypothetical protein